MKIQALITVTRDIISLGIGTFGIVHQEWTGHVSPALLAVYAAFLGLPGTISLLMLGRGKPSDQRTAESSQSSVSP